MAKLNGTAVLVYADGTLIAAQKGCTVNLTQALFDTSTKEDAGWSTHGNGMRNADVSIDGLASTTGLSVKELFAYITSRTSLLLVIDGLGYPCVCQVDVASSSISGPQEDATTINGSFKVKGNLYYLADTNVNLVTSPSSGGTDYDTLTVSVIKIISAINIAGGATCKSNSFAVAIGNIIKVAVFLTRTSGELPSMTIFEVGGGAAAISNAVQLTEGLNFITLTATDTHTGCLNITNTGASNFSLSNIYCFKA